jgi:hypothetical protein
MPRSKVRGGRKAHNKRVKDRNAQNQDNWQKAVNFAYKKHEEWKASKSGETQDISFNVK